MVLSLVQLSRKSAYEREELWVTPRFCGVTLQDNSMNFHQRVNPSWQPLGKTMNSPPPLTATVFLWPYPILLTAKYQKWVNAANLSRGWTCCCLDPWLLCVWPAAALWLAIRLYKENKTENKSKWEEHQTLHVKWIRLTSLLSLILCVYHLAPLRSYKWNTHPFRSSTDYIWVPLDRESSWFFVSDNHSQWMLNDHVSVFLPLFTSHENLPGACIPNQNRRLLACFHLWSAPRVFWEPVESPSMLRPHSLVGGGVSNDGPVRTPVCLKHWAWKRRLIGLPKGWLSLLRKVDLLFNDLLWSWSGEWGWVVYFLNQGRLCLRTCFRDAACAFLPFSRESPPRGWGRAASPMPSQSRPTFHR